MFAEDKELRMYALVHRSLSPIQQGIQALHAVVELQQRAYQPSTVAEYSAELLNDWKAWAGHDKTQIVLNGGSHLELIDAAAKLEELGIKTATFREPDLNDCVTAVAFIVDERVWNKEMYPDFEYDPMMAATHYEDDFTIQYERWAARLGDNIAAIRQYLFAFKLA